MRAAARILLLCLLLPGCSTVYSPVPLGEQPVAIDPTEWDGLWTGPDVGLVVKTLDAEKGLLDVLFIDGNSTNEILVHVRESGGWWFASTRDLEFLSKEEAEERSKSPIAIAGPYGFFRIVIDEQMMVLWEPSAKQFARVVEAGHLPGEVERGEYDINVTLEALTPEHYRIITESTHGVLLNWDEPLVLTRIAPKNPTPTP